MILMAPITSRDAWSVGARRSRETSNRAADAQRECLRQTDCYEIQQHLHRDSPFNRIRCDIACSVTNILKIAGVWDEEAAVVQKSAATNPSPPDADRSKIATSTHDT